MVESPASAPFSESSATRAFAPDALDITSVRYAQFHTKTISPSGKKLLDKVEQYKQLTEPVRAAGIYPFFRPISSCQNPFVTIEGQDLIMMGSNNYLGLVSDPRVIEASREAALKFGTGCAGSRLLNGNAKIHSELEERLADFVQKPAALLFPTGYQANVGTIATIAGRRDAVVIDKRNHASIVDGVYLSRAEVYRFKHNDTKDLDRVLNTIPQSQGVLVVVDGVFSMEGDVAPVPEIEALCEKRKAVFVVDDAHGLGVLGPGGRGTCAQFGITDEVDIIVGTFSKSLASIGGFAAADVDTIDYLRHNSRAMVFSASMPPASAAATLKALEIILAEPERIARLWENTEIMREGLLSMGLNLGGSTTPIMPILVGQDLKAFQMCARLHEEGVFVNPVPGLSVDAGALIRISIMATHEKKHLEFALDKIEKVGKELGLV